MANTDVDFTVQNHGTIFLLCPATPEAEAWVEENLPEDRMTWAGRDVVIEHRFICSIVDGIQSDGLVVA